MLPRLTRHDWPGFLGRLGHDFVGLGDAHDFLDRCLALGNATPAILPQRFHAFGNRALLELTAITFLHDHFTKRLGHETNFVNRGASLITGLPALIATGSAAELRAEFLNRKAYFGQIFFRIIDNPDALRADRAHETLRDERFHDG